MSEYMKNVLVAIVVAVGILGSIALLVVLGTTNNTSDNERRAANCAAVAAIPADQRQGVNLEDVC